MSVALVDLGILVDLRGERARLERAGIRAETHRGALVAHVPLLGHEVYDAMRRIDVELGAVRALEPAHVARVLDDGHLHAETDAEERHVLLAGPLDRADLAL